MRTATEKDFKYGAYLYDEEGNEFIIRDKYDDGIYETHKGNVLFSGDARFYRVKQESA